jgi:hypothetical protein
MSATISPDDHPSGRPLFNDEALAGPQGGTHLGDGPFAVTPPDGPFHLDFDPETVRRIVEEAAGDPGELVFAGSVPHLSLAGWAYDPTCCCGLCTSSEERPRDV